MTFLFSLFLIISIIISGTASAKPKVAWEENSHPDIMGQYFIRKFSALPTEGKVTTNSHFWSGDYWALRKGNINYRWYAKNKTGHNLNSPTKEKTRLMTIPELAELSPSEKYDLFSGRYDYPLRNEVSKIANPSAQVWEGICHGWSAATMNHPEPRPKLMKNPDGIEIPFGSSDIKALLSYYYAYVFKAPDTHQMGRRCFKRGVISRDKDCFEDMNAGAFHIILANRIGLNGKGVIADLQRFEQVWNHPITSYESLVLRETGPDTQSAPGTVVKKEMETVITYVDENGNDWRPVIGTKKQSFDTLTYKYTLDLNASGEIIGGNWTSQDRPDFLWIMQRPRQFEGILSRLEELLD
jgi:hypothetical protein